MEKEDGERNSPANCFFGYFSTVSTEQKSSRQETEVYFKWKDCYKRRKGTKKEKYCDRRFDVRT